MKLKKIKTALRIIATVATVALVIVEKLEKRRRSSSRERGWARRRHVSQQELSALLCFGGLRWPDESQGVAKACAAQIAA